MEQVFYFPATQQPETFAKCLPSSGNLNLTYKTNPSYYQLFSLSPSEKLKITIGFLNSLYFFYLLACFGRLQSLQINKCSYQCGVLIRLISVESIANKVSIFPQILSSISVQPRFLLFKFIKVAGVQNIFKL